MNERTPIPEGPAAESPLMAVAICHDAADGLAFIQSVLDTQGPAAEGDVLFEDRVVRIECLATNPETHAGWKNRVNRADVLILLLRHLDPVSMGGARIRFGRLGGNRRAPLGVFVLREPGEQEYKIGCAACGQKLWMQEADVGKRGRCPNCRAGFQIPSPMDYLRARILIPDAVPILNVIRGDVAICRGALANLLARTAVRLTLPARPQQEAFLKQATVPIQVEGNSLRVGKP